MYSTKLEMVCGPLPSWPLPYNYLFLVITDFHPPLKFSATLWADDLRCTIAVLLLITSIVSLMNASRTSLSYMTASSSKNSTSWKHPLVFPTFLIVSAFIFLNPGVSNRTCIFLVTRNHTFSELFYRPHWYWCPIKCCNWCFCKVSWYAFTSHACYLFRSLDSGWSNYRIAIRYFKHNNPSSTISQSWLAFAQKILSRRSKWKSSNPNCTCIKLLPI